MPSDLTRPATGDLRQHYEAVVMQQGRVILDRDFNALQDIVNGRIAADALDEIGPCGTPVADDGLAVSLPPGAASVSAPVSFSAPDPFDFLVKPGTIYVGGQRVVFEAPPAGQPPLSYFHQPDWPSPPDPFARGSASFSAPQRELVALHAFEQEVGAVEDPELLDVALGGPDTTQRVRLMRRIVRLGVTGADCAEALADAVAEWGRHGYLFDPLAMRLRPQTALQVTFTGPASASNPCDPAAQGGYLGAENQLIRVMIRGPGDGGSPALLWGYDNASSLYRVAVHPDATTLQLAQAPVDAFRIPAKGQYVEVLRTAAVLGSQPDQAGGPPIVRCVAAATGHVATVETYSTTDNTLVLDAPLPEKYTSEQNPLFLRVWVGRQPFDPSSAVPVPLTDPTGQTSPGLQVTVTQPPSAATGAALPAGAFWLFAVRPATPQALYPGRFLDGPQPPDGPRQWACPLAVINWSAGASFSGPDDRVTDCRPKFDNLVTLTARQLGACCTLAVGPADAPRLQQVLDRAAVYGKATICFGPGTYLLPRSLRLTARHSGLTLEACQGGARLRAATGAPRGSFLDGLVVIVGAADVSLRGLSFSPPAEVFSLAVDDAIRVISSPTEGQITLTALVGVRAVNSRSLTLEDCSFDHAAKVAPGTLLFAAGLFVAGDCTGLTVRGCRFTSQVPVALTPNPAGQPTSPDAVPAFAALFGVTAVPSAPSKESRGPGAGAYLRTVLDEATLRDNQFAGLSAALFAFGPDVGRALIQGNRATGCTCGFWLVSFESQLRLFGDESAGPQLIARAAGQFQEPQLGYWAARLYPLPAEVDPGTTIQVPAPPPGPTVPTAPAGYLFFRASAIDQQQQDVQVVPVPSTPLQNLSLSVLDNSAEFVSAKAFGTTALLLVVCQRFLDQFSPQQRTVIVSSNAARTSSPIRMVPVAVVVTSGPATLTGNVIANANSLDGTSLSLSIFNTDGAPPGSPKWLAVTGNVLVGRTNLGALARTGLPAPLHSWLEWNSQTNAEG
jgi:hypothetical protein